MRTFHWLLIVESCKDKRAVRIKLSVSIQAFAMESLEEVDLWLKETIFYLLETY